jgi:hypothetical protein
VGGTRADLASTATGGVMVVIVMSMRVACGLCLSSISD